MNLSIIIPVYKRSYLLSFGLTSLFKQNINIDYEIIIIDDNYDDEEIKKTKAVVDNFDLPIKYFSIGKRKQGDIWTPPSIPINRGVKEAKGEKILIACPEVYSIGDTVQSLYDNTILKNEYVSVIGRDDNNGHVLKYLEEHREINSTIMTKTQGLNVVLPFFQCIYKELFNSVGGYDERFNEGIAFDDNDYIKRLNEKGGKHKSIGDQNLRVVHLYHDRDAKYKNGGGARWKRNQDRMNGIL